MLASCQLCAYYPLCCAVTCITTHSCFDAGLEVGSNHNTAHVLHAITHSGADIVCLQETHNGWEQAARACAELMQIYPQQIWHSPCGGYYASGLALLWKASHKLIAESVETPKVAGSFFPGQRATFSLFHPPSHSAAAANDKDAKQPTAVADAVVSSAAHGPAPASAAAPAITAPATAAEVTMPRAAAADSKHSKQDAVGTDASKLSAAAAAAAPGGSASASAVTTSAAAPAPAPAQGLAVLQVVNVHLRPPLSMGGSGDDTAWGNVKSYLWDTTAIRMSEVAWFVNPLLGASRRPHLLCGDFNEGAMGSAVSWMLGQGYGDALSRSDTQTTWYWPLLWKLELVCVLASKRERKGTLAGAGTDDPFLLWERSLVRTIICFTTRKQVWRALIAKF